MRVNEGLAQVFDGNTDFISQSPTAAKTLHSGMMRLLFNFRTVKLMLVLFDFLIRIGIKTFECNFY